MTEHMERRRLDLIARQQAGEDVYKRQLKDKAAGQDSLMAAVRARIKGMRED